MLFKTKYIRTENNQIIVFSGLLQHIQFSHFSPISAGFIAFGVRPDENGRAEVHCECYGESVSLKLKSNEESDTELAMKQILGYGY